MLKSCDDNVLNKRENAWKYPIFDDISHFHRKSEGKFLDRKESSSHAKVNISLTSIFDRNLMHKLCLCPRLSQFKAQQCDFKTKSWPLRSLQFWFLFFWIHWMYWFGIFVHCTRLRYFCRKVPIVSIYADGQFGFYLIIDVSWKSFPDSEPFYLRISWVQSKKLWLENSFI